MPFTFPTDSNGNAGAVKQTADGNDYRVPTWEQGSESLTGALATVTTAGTAIQLPSLACRKVLIIALKSNTGSIYLGGSNVSSTVYGAELQARDSIEVEISNTNLVYLNASVNGEGVSYLAI
jgi:hypothetical protein